MADNESYEDASRANRAPRGDSGRCTPLKQLSSASYMRHKHTSAGLLCLISRIGGLCAGELWKPYFMHRKINNEFHNSPNLGSDDGGLAGAIERVRGLKGRN